MATAGSIVVDILARTGSFETDTKRAEKRLAAFRKEIEATGRAIGTGIGTAVIAGAAAVGALAIAFDQLVKGASQFQDLAEETGASAEGLASFALAAAGAGVSMESIAAASIKLTKGLVGVDDESKAAGAALASLGLNVKDFKQLDPAAQYEAVGKALAGFADGAGKTAVAVALFGKAGAEQLKVFKQLEEQGGRQVILTQAQIELADKYADAQAVSLKRLQLFAQAAATEFLPALTDVQGALTDLIKGMTGVGSEATKLGNSTALAEFADNVADAFARAVDAGRSVSGAFVAVGTFLGASAAKVAALARGDFAQARIITEEYRADLEKSAKATESFFDKLQRTRDARKAGLTGERGTAKTDPRSLTFGQDLPVLNFDGAEKKAKKASTADTEAQKYLETLQKQLEKTLQLTAYEQALTDIQQKRIKGITPAIEAEILAQAKLLDVSKQAKEFRDAEIQTTTAIAKAKLESLETLNKSNEELAKEIDLLGLSAEQLAAVELQRVRVTRAEKESTLAKLEATGVAEQQLQVLQEEIAALQKREQLLGVKADKLVDVSAEESARKTGDTYRDTLSDSIAEGLLDGFRKGQSFSDIVLNELKAQFAKTVLSPLIRPVVDESNKAIADLFKQFGGYFSGSSGGFSTNSTGTSLPTAGGAATGTNFVERDMLTILHKGEAVVPKAYNPANGGGGGVTIINNTPVSVRQAGTDDKGNTRILIEEVLQQASRQTQADFASGTGPVAKAAQQRFGLGAGNLAKRG